MFKSDIYTSAVLSPQFHSDALKERNKCRLNFRKAKRDAKMVAFRTTAEFICTFRAMIIEECERELSRSKLQ
jgi:hypothetical protein